MDGEPHAGISSEVNRKMIEIKIKGRRKAYYVAEWKDVKAIVERHLKQNKAFYAQLAEL